MTTTASSYTRAAIRFHWASAAAIILMWPIGKVMVGTKPPSQFLYSIHVGLGLVVAVVTVARAISLWRGPRPDELDMPHWERTLFVANHYVLYGLLVVLSLTGIVMLLAAGSFDAIALRKSDGPKNQHEIASLVFLLMFVIHVAGVIYYQVTKGKTLRRMGIPVD